MSKDGPLSKVPLVAGIALTILGIALLFWTQNFVEGLLRWWPSVFTVFGLLFLYRYFFHKAKPKFLLMGLLFFLTGTFILLLNTLLSPWFSLKELWPVFMGILGFSLLPYGFRFRRKIRVSLIVPGVFLIFFMIVFLLFSLSVIEISFAQFVTLWWPLLLVFMGVTLVLSYYMRNLDRSQNNTDA